MFQIQYLVGICLNVAYGNLERSKRTKNGRVTFIDVVQDKKEVARIQYDVYGAYRETLLDRRHIQIDVRKCYLRTIYGINIDTFKIFIV